MWSYFAKIQLVIMTVEITVEELKARLDHGEKMTLIDVREPEEYAICHLEGARHIPMNELPTHLDGLKNDDFLVLYCHYGNRCAQATLWLRQNGFENVRNLEGGIDAWAQIIDPSMARY